VRGAEFIAGKGFRVTYREDIFSRSDYLAGGDERRAEELNGYLGDPEVRAILLARGGYGTSRILKALSTAAFRRKPKLVAGYSDATALLLYLQQRCGAVVFNGPFVTDGQRELSRLLRLLQGPKRPLVIPGLRPLSAGRVRAPLTGGNLSLLAHSIGTPFEVEARGRILFVEELNEAPYRIDRMVRQLALAGVFRGIRGLLIGGFTGCGRGAGKKAEAILLEAVQGRKIPVAAGFPVGHGSVNRSFPLGVPAVLDTTARSLTFAPFFPAPTPRTKAGKSRRGRTH
jgi:muramoyltetrapeptide carboxypeptidase